MQHSILIYLKNTNATRKAKVTNVFGELRNSSPTKYLVALCSKHKHKQPVGYWQCELIKFL